MNLDPGESQIQILLINIDFLSLFLSLFCFPRKLTDRDEKSAELNLDQGCVLTD